MNKEGRGLQRKTKHSMIWLWVFKSVTSVVEMLQSTGVVWSCWGVIES